MDSTRSTETMREWARRATGPELRACRDEAERHGDRELVTIAQAEIDRRTSR